MIRMRAAIVDTEFCIVSAGVGMLRGISKVRDLVIQGLMERAVMQRSTGSGLGELRMPT